MKQYSQKQRCKIACLIIIIMLFVWLLSEWMRVKRIWEIHSFSRWYVCLPTVFQIVFGCIMALVFSILLFCHERKFFCYFLSLFAIFFLIDLSFRYRDHQTINLHNAFHQRGHYIFFLLLLISIVIYFIGSFKQWAKDLLRSLIVLALAINVGFLIFFNIQWYMQNNKVNYTPDYSEYTSWLGFIEFIMFVLLMVWLWRHHHD